MTGIVDFRTSLLDENGNPINSGNPLPTTGGGGGGGGGVLSDTVFIDNTNQLFVYRDTGSGTPSAYAIPAWTLYTPTAPISFPGGGGGGGGSLSDTVFVDSTGQLFVYRDTGSGTPNAFSIPAWTLYTPVGAVTTPQRDAAEDTKMLLTRMLNYLNAPMGYDKSLQRQRGTVVVESGTVTTVTTVTTVSTVTTCSTLTTLSNFDGYNARMQILDQNRVSWAQCVRARIT